MLCLFYTPPTPRQEGDPVYTINIVGILIGGTFASLIVVPTMVSFAWLYEPIIFVRFGSWCLRAFFCWPCWLGAYFAPSTAQRVGHARDLARERARHAQARALQTVTNTRNAWRARKVNPEPVTSSEAGVGRVARKYHAGDVEARNGGHLIVEDVEQDHIQELVQALEEGAMVIKPVASLKSAWTAFQAAKAASLAVPSEPPPPPPPSNVAKVQLLRQLFPPNADDEMPPRLPPPLPSPPPSPPQGEPTRDTMRATRAYSYESLNEGLLKASLTHSIKRKDWPTVKKILFGWSANLTIFFVLLFVFNLYGCQLFEPRETSHKTIVYETKGGQGGGRRSGGGGQTEALAGNTDEFIFSWCLSIFQRFVLHEPTLILAAKGLPILFGSTFCTNLCGETIVNLLTVVFEGIAACMAALATQ